MHALRRALITASRYPPVAVCCMLMVGGPSCMGYEWPPPEKEYAWVPYVESISVPDEITALLTFDVIITLSTAADPELLDESRYKWMVRSEFPYTDDGEPYTVQVVRATGPQYGGGTDPWLLNEGQPNQLKMALHIPRAGPHTIRVLSSATQAEGGRQVAVQRGYNMGGEYFYLINDPPAGTAYKELIVTVGEPRFEDAYEYGYLPYVEEIVAPRQLLAFYPAVLLVRLSAQTASAEAAPLSMREDIYAQRYMFFFEDPPASGAYAGLVSFTGSEFGTARPGFYTADTREQGGMQLILHRYPQYADSWEKSGQTGYTIRQLEIEILDPPRHDLGDYFDVHFPYVTDAEIPDHINELEPFAIGVQLDSGLPDLSGGRGYYLHQYCAMEDGVLTVVLYYEPHERGLAVEETPVVLGGLTAGDYVMRIYSVPSPEQAGWLLPLKYRFGLTTPMPAEMPAELIQREFNFTVEPAS